MYIDKVIQIDITHEWRHWTDQRNSVKTIKEIGIMLIVFFMSLIVLTFMNNRPMLAIGEFLILFVIILFLGGMEDKRKSVLL